MFFPPQTDCVSEVARLDHLDEASPLGFSAVELLARASGESSSPLVWLPPSSGPEYRLEYGPEHGVSTLQLQVAAAEGDVLYHSETPAPGAAEEVQCAPSVLDVPVRVTLQSGAQALDESFAARLLASTPYRASFSHSFAPGSLGGGLLTDVGSLDPERRISAGALLLDVTVWQGGSSGTLRAVLQSDYAQPSKELRPALAPPGEPQSLAVWPSAESCPDTGRHLPSSARVLGFSVEDVQRSLGSAAPRPLTWSSGDTTEVRLELEAPPSELCQSIEDELAFDAILHAHTLDDRLDAELPVQVSVASDAGSMGAIAIRSSEPSSATSANPGVPHPAPPHLKGIDRKGYEVVRVELAATFQAGSSEGTLTVLGLEDAAQEAAGTELESARWSP
ncbi:MAG TPA: hypothetical protein VG963_03470 [Polyangiaceae bacterium]|nr:hypothetical protein [Polyangiaceae bacterium]